MSKLHLSAIGAFVALIGTSAAPLPASARVFSNLFPTAEQSAPQNAPLGVQWMQYLPPTGYIGQNWTHPNGCAYARNGRRDREIWVLERGVDYLNCASIIAHSGYLEAY